MTPTPLRMLVRITVREDGCWDYGTVGNHGYGYTRIRGFKSQQLTHRVMWEAYFGKVPSGLVLDHLCRNRACCNPWHLEATTQRENVLRGNGLQAANAKKTHCIKGHPFTEDNIYRQAKRPNYRQCIKCMRAQSKAWKAENRNRKKKCRISSISP